MRRPIPILAGAVLWAGASLLPARGAETTREQLGDIDVGERWVYDDWPAAQAFARKTRKPIFALFR